MKKRTRIGCLFVAMLSLLWCDLGWARWLPLSPATGALVNPGQYGVFAEFATRGGAATLRWNNSGVDEPFLVLAGDATTAAVVSGIGARRIMHIAGQNTAHFATWGGIWFQPGRHFSAGINPSIGGAIRLGPASSMHFAIDTHVFVGFGQIVPFEVDVGTVIGFEVGRKNRIGILVRPRAVWPGTRIPAIEVDVSFVIRAAVARRS